MLGVRGKRTTSTDCVVRIGGVTIRQHGIRPHHLSSEPSHMNHGTTVGKEYSWRTSWPVSDSSWCTDSKTTDVVTLRSGRFHSRETTSMCPSSDKHVHTVFNGRTVRRTYQTNWRWKRISSSSGDRVHPSTCPTKLSLPRNSHRPHISTSDPAHKKPPRPGPHFSL